MSDLSTVEDPRTEGVICGVTHHTGKVEWICIKEPHQQLVKRRNAAFPVPRNNPTSEAHYFINRWPHRP